VRSLTLSSLGGSLAVCRLDPTAPVPDWAWAGPVASVTRTPDELSVVCAESGVPAEVRCERGWHGYRVAGPLAFSEVGVLAALVGPLAGAGVSVFAVSTFDTDYLLVKRSSSARAAEVLRAAGHLIDGAGGHGTVTASG
jgi:hypothetical protein